LFFISFILFPFKSYTFNGSVSPFQVQLLVIIKYWLLSSKKQAEYKKPFLFIFLKLYKHSKFCTFHNLILLSSADTDIIKSLLLIISKQCLIFEISFSWAFFISAIFLFLIKLKEIIDLFFFE
jgi:hypothetical protein